MLFKIVKLLAVVLVLLAIFIVYKLNLPVIVTTEEVFRDDEAEQIQRSVDNFLRIVEQNKTDYVARGAHSKGHACVKAYFDVNNDIPTEYQHGVFHKPGNRFKSWIRFSNGASRVEGNNDYNKDARGMAIKLINIYEQGIKQTVDSPLQQDFLMHNSPVFFTANMQDYNEFTEYPNKVLYFLSSVNPFDWKIRELKHGLATLKAPPPSPLNNQYFSNTAYKLGSHNIKFSAKACASNEIVDVNKQDIDFLRKAMVKQLGNSNACFDFLIQVQMPEHAMPIEDPSILWQEQHSPFIPIAKITIPQQQFDTAEQQQFCEDLSFSPWNALAEHRPIGELNRIRKAVYAASSKYRHQQNQRPVPTNLSW